MTPHKHHDVIVAWATGATVQYKCGGAWRDIFVKPPTWGENEVYRVKPEPRPDVVLYAYISFLNCDTASIQPVNADTRKLKTDTCMFVFDGETGVLKKAEVINEA